MFNKGDRIVYPMYGAGIVERLEDKHIVLNIPVGNLTIRVSSAMANGLSVRPILHRDKILAELCGVIGMLINMPDNWNLRYKQNMDRIRSGELWQVATVFHGLMLRERERGLSTAEKKMMTTTKQIILSELILSLDVDRPEAEAILDETFR